MESILHPVRPVDPVAPYLGGKRNLAARLVEIIDAVPHSTYAEAFVGMAGVFFRRTRRPAAEVINDISEDVSTFFRVLQRHYVPFLDLLRWQVTTRAGFEKLRDQLPSSLTDLERSARFLYLQRLAFGGRVKGRTFGVALDRPARFDITRLAPMLEAAHERLAGVVIERLPWSRFVTTYDAPGTLFYLDPPYWGCETDYGADVFARADFAALASQLATISGRFILSINDVPEIRDMFAGFAIQPVETTYTAGVGNGVAAKELIISNLDPAQLLFGHAAQASREPGLPW